MKSPGGMSDGELHRRFRGQSHPCRGVLGVSQLDVCRKHLPEPRALPNRLPTSAVPCSPIPRLCHHAARCTIVGDNFGMHAFKVRGRIESVVWDPPLLTFTMTLSNAAQGARSTLRCR